jgi:hypothetical protein
LTITVVTYGRSTRLCRPTYPPPRREASHRGVGCHGASQSINFPPFGQVLQLDGSNFADHEFELLDKNNERVKTALLQRPSLIQPMEITRGPEELAFNTMLESVRKGTPRSSAHERSVR